MIAKQFFSEYSADPEFVIFASGVSNSRQEDENSFRREEDLLMDTIKKFSDSKLVYFGTCSIYDPSLGSSAYIRHKLHMEGRIRDNSPRHLICRTTNLVGQTNNQNTIVNYLVQKIFSREKFICWKLAVRNILDIDDFYTVAREMLHRLPYEDGRTINVSNPVSYTINEIISAIEKFGGVQAVYTEEDQGSRFEIPDEGNTMQIFKSMGIHFGEDYLDRVLKKYYS